MSTVRFIRKREEWAHPPNPDPKKKSQWIPRYKWVSDMGGVGAPTLLVLNQYAKSAGLVRFVIVHRNVRV